VDGSEEVCLISISIQSYGGRGLYSFLKCHLSKFQLHSVHPVPPLNTLPSSFRVGVHKRWGPLTYPAISLLKLNGAPDSLDLKNLSRPIHFWGQDARVPSWSGPRLRVCFTPSSNPSSSCICNHVLHFSSMGSASFRAQRGRVVSFPPPEFEAVRRALAHPLPCRQTVYGSRLRKITQGYADADADTKSNSPLRSRSGPRGLSGRSMGSSLDNRRYLVELLPNSAADPLPR